MEQADDGAVASESSRDRPGRRVRRGGGAAARADVPFQQGNSTGELLREGL